MEKNKQSIELANELFSALEEMINLPNKSNVEIFNSKLSDYRDSWMKDSIENLPLVQSIDLSVNSNKRPSISLSKDTINALDYIANISKKFLNGTDFERIIKALKDTQNINQEKQVYVIRVIDLEMRQKRLKDL